MKYIKLVFFCFILFGFVVNPVQGKTATNQDQWGLMVETKDGNVSVFTLQENPKVHFADGMMTVSLRDFSMELSNIKRWYFEGISSGIANINKSNLKVTYNNSTLVFEGDDLANNLISAYDIQGRAITPHVENSVSRVSVSLESMPAGNYIIVFNNNSYKVIKK